VIQSDLPEDKQTVHRLLAQELGKLGEPAREEDGVWLNNWRGIRVTADTIAIAPAEARPDQLLARADLTFTYNVEKPYTAVRTHTVGLGGNRAAALKHAVDLWIAGTAPALISHIYGELRHGAEYSPAGDPLGITGWDCISGPYLFTGREAIKEEAAAYVQQHALIAPVGEVLSRALDPSRFYHSVVLYHAMSADSSFADVLIDNENFEPAAGILREVFLPHESAPDGFISVRQFLLCCRPE
jgi:hypothetical protein